MLKALIKEIEIRAKENNPAFNEIATIYIGGGTPTAYTPDELGRLVAAIKSNFYSQNIIEFTVEANPDDLSAPYLEGLRRVGVDRLSIGVQSFIERDLKWMNRGHTARQAIESVKLSRRLGFNNITVDLIYGIPGMSVDEWRYNLETAISLNIQHLSAYHLTIEEKTVFGKRQKKNLITPIAEEQSERQFILLRELTASSGFEHYEVSNFAKNKMYGIHNSGYWKQQPYIGIGPSAHSYDGERRRWNVSNNIRYLEKINTAAIFFEEEHLDIPAKYNEYILTSLRTNWGVSLDYIEKRFGKYFQEYFEERSKKLILSGCLVPKNRNVKISTSYVFLSDSIVSSLIFV
jgi:oxygen-independent coproporphyrinogen-3 oxidase